ncbi:MAG: A/G-specific adenine glycosylase [Rhodoferax sp.]|nr:MAG: A/G-specific adenine glycosylase [Rhodoferax sp.]
MVRWQQEHGRNQLPWQGTRDPYRVWLSEIMLQQTQVSTVIDYFARFTERFADVRALAQAHEDEVMGLWSGLGYYTRARNLHRCAQAVVAQHGGQFPCDAVTLATLPGIGRSTASAIASICFGERVAILDANVKRVVGRVFAFEGDLSQAKQERALWVLAEQLLPTAAQASSQMPRYTQGMMDLGAKLCTPKNPQCLRCPVRAMCQGAEADPTRFPVRSRKLKRSSEQVWALWLQRPDGAVWLQQRPAQGIWARLYCLPVWNEPASLEAAVAGRLAKAPREDLPVFLHVLTHKDLHIHPVRVRVQDASEVALEEGAWYAADAWRQLGLPAPVRKLLESASD